MKTLYVDVFFPKKGESSFLYSLSVNEEIKESLLIGARVLAPFRNQKEKPGLITNVNAKLPNVHFEIKPITKLVDLQSTLSPGQTDLARWISRYYFCSIGHALSLMLPLQKTKTRALKQEEHKENKETCFEPAQLFPEQQAAVKAITSSQEKETFYLEGVTGSGKGEVLLRAAEEMLQQGKGVIYLVPEIALTQELVERAEKRISSPVSVLHSKLTPREKRNELERLSSGAARLALGPRSAIFAPVQNLGLIIIDEEQDDSYKSSQTPMYHARQVAFWRAAHSQSKIVLSSATPSLESILAVKQGLFKHLLLSKRISGGELATETIVDLRGEKSLISAELIRALQEETALQGQALIFLNRRGYTYFLHCTLCGYEAFCPRCAVPLTYHQNEKLLKCHYCGYSRKTGALCPKCHKDGLEFKGVGTELIASEIARIFPHLRVGRLDRDSVTPKGAQEQIIYDFREKNIDILVGTQMLSKGLNFPHVGLSVILNADQALLIPDFRSAERAFSSILQVAGRAGRFKKNGRVLIQTYSPENNIIKSIVERKPKEFYEGELEVRRSVGFPPYSRLIRVLFRSRKKDEADKDAKKFSEQLGRALSPSDGELLGPCPAPIAKINDFYRMHCIIKCYKFKVVHVTLSRIVEEENTLTAKIEIDVDPLNLL